MNDVVPSLLAMVNIWAKIYQFPDIDLTDNDFFLRPKVNEMGAALLPMVNVWATKLTTFQFSSPNFQLGTNFYPGESHCNKWNPHAKWHLESSIALVDFVYLGDEIFRLLNKT